jgi:hypothetical protein
LGVRRYGTTPVTSRPKALVLSMIPQPALPMVWLAMVGPRTSQIPARMRLHPAKVATTTTTHDRARNSIQPSHRSVIKLVGVLARPAWPAAIGPSTGPPPRS